MRTLVWLQEGEENGFVIAEIPDDAQRYKSWTEAKAALDREEKGE